MSAKLTGGQAHQTDWRASPPHTSADKQPLQYWSGIITPDVAVELLFRKMWSPIKVGYKCSRTALRCQM